MKKSSRRKILILVTGSLCALSFPLLANAAESRAENQLNAAATTVRSGSARDADGLTPLHLAAGRGDTRAVAQLLNEGADLFSLDSKMGVSVLHKAVYSGKADTVKLLLEHGALVNLQSPSNGDTPLHDAIYFKRGDDLSVVQVLLEHGASQAIRNRAGLLPIESTRVLGDRAAEQLLTEFEKRRQSPGSRKLMTAVKANDASAVRSLLQTENINLCETDEQGFPPLLWAAREGYDEIVKMLLDAKANPNQNDQWMGATAGHKAAFWGRPETMKLLIAHGLSLDDRGGYNGYTALMDAVTRNHFEVAKELVDAGANVNIKGHDNLTAIDIARMNGNQRMLDLLLHSSTVTPSKR